MKVLLVGLLLMAAGRSEAQDWHVSTEPVYFFLKSPNVALDYKVSSSLSVGFQYAPLEWGDQGKNLSGFQFFYSRTSEIGSDSELLKLYAGLLSSRTSVLKIESGDDPLPLFEVMYGYRWVTESRFTTAILAGTFFTSRNIYPSASLAIGYLF